jgi:transposase InsO family protein
MGSIGDCFDNSVAESFFGTLQLELLDEHHWTSRQQLALAVTRSVRLDRDLVQPPPPTQLLQHAQPDRLRDHQRGMIPTTNPSAGTGKAHGALVAAVLCLGTILATS